jgi:hypothetical protein
MNNKETKQLEEEQKYRIELSNHTNFYQKQKDVVFRLELRLMEKYCLNDGTDFEDIVRQEIKNELAYLNEKESMGRPNKPGYYRANDD